MVPDTRVGSGDADDDIVHPNSLDAAGGDVKDDDDNEDDAGGDDNDVALGYVKLPMLGRLPYNLPMRLNSITSPRTCVHIPGVFCIRSRI